jgi:hypothetical protein
VERSDAVSAIIKSQRENLSKYKTKNAGKVQTINELSDRYRLSVGICSFLALSSTLIWCIEEELTLQYGKSYIYDRVLLLIAHFVITLFLAFNIYHSYVLWLDMKRATGKMLKIDTYTFNEQILLIIEVAINLVGPLPPLVNVTFQEKVYVADIDAPKRVNTIFLTMMFFLRSYHLFRPILYYSYYMCNRAYRICDIGSHSCSFMFAIKWWFNTSPLYITMSMYWFSTIFFGALLRYNEEQAHVYNEELQHFSWANSWWCAYITMTTVGYGDFYPTTMLGRNVGVLCAFVGVFLTSISVIVLFQILEFTPTEELSFKLLSLLAKKEKLMKRAVMMMTWQFKMNKYKRPRAIKRYSAALMFFKSTAKNLNLQKLSMQKPSDYIRSDIADIKKDTTHAKEMIKALLLYTQKKEQINNVNGPNPNK